MTRRRIGLIVTLALGLCCAPLADTAQPAAKVPRIGLLSPFSPATGDRFGQATVDAFRQGFQALGYIEGQTLRIEYRWAEGHPERLAALAAQSRLPAMYQGQEFAEAGGLMSYGTDRLDQWRRAATYVDKILKGANPADLPVEQPTTFELVISLKTAQALGLTIPPSLLFQATEVLR